MGCRGSLGTQGGLCKQGSVVTRKRNLFSRLPVGLPGNISWEQRLSGLRVFFFLIKKEKKSLRNSNLVHFTSQAGKPRSSENRRLCLSAMLGCARSVMLCQSHHPSLCPLPCSSPKETARNTNSFGTTACQAPSHITGVFYLGLEWPRLPLSFNAPT